MRLAWLSVEEHQYQRQWQAFRKHRNLIVALIIAEFLGFLPFLVLATVVERTLFKKTGVSFPVVILYGILYIVTGSQLRRFLCPRCGKNFFGGVFATFETMMGRKCPNCGLRRYEGE
jgi:DNA-directed RNA polymerase subunit RPC12/RpoP